MSHYNYTSCPYRGPERLKYHKTTINQNPQNICEWAIAITLQYMMIFPALTEVLFCGSLWSGHLLLFCINIPHITTQLGMPNSIEETKFYHMHWYAIFWTILTCCGSRPLDTQLLRLLTVNFFITLLLLWIMALTYQYGVCIWTSYNNWSCYKGWELSI